LSKETTTSYRWGDGNVITRIDVRRQDNGRAVAYIYADESEEARAQRLDIRAAIRLKGWGTLSDHRNGNFTLRVSGLKSGKELVDTLTKQGFVTSAPSVTNQEVEGARSKSAWEFIKNNSLRVSGLIYMLGNGLYYASGVVGKNESRRHMAASFAVGDAMLGVFGGRDDARQFKSLLSKLKSHMDSNGIEIPKNAAINVETSSNDRSFGTRVVDFLHTNINPIKIGAEVLGGFFAIREGLNLKKSGKGEKDWPMLIGGIVVMVGWAAALLIKEKKPDEEKLKDASSTDKAAAYIEEKPLRLAGWAGLAFNILNFGSAWKIRDSTEGKLKLGGVASMVSANGLYSISNKTTGGDIKAGEMVSDVYMVAAQILNKQPENVREAAVASTANFLGERPEIKDTHQQIIVRLKEEMALQRQNPWFEKRGLPPYTPVAKKGHRKDEVPEHAPTPATTISGPAQGYIAPAREAAAEFAMQ